MELIRYKPGEAIRWLQTGAQNIRRGATTRGKSLVRQEGTDQRSFGENVKTAAGAIMDLGKSAYTDMVHQQAEASEFVLQDEHFDIVKGASIKSIPYKRVKAVELRGERATLILDKGNVVIKPFAHLVAGRVRVPVGWSRNGIEVSYDLLIEELAARCGLDVEEA